MEYGGHLHLQAHLKISLWIKRKNKTTLECIKFTCTSLVALNIRKEWLKYTHTVYLACKWKKHNVLLTCTNTEYRYIYVSLWNILYKSETIVVINVQVLNDIYKHMCTYKCIPPFVIVREFWTNSFCFSFQYNNSKYPRHKIRIL